MKDVTEDVTEDVAEDVMEDVMEDGVEPGHPRERRRVTDTGRLDTMDVSKQLVVRQRIFAGLVTASVVSAASVLGYLLAGNGFSIADACLLAAFCVSTPWVVIGFWNSLIGFALVAFTPDWLRRISTLSPDYDGPVTTRTALLVPIFNEDPDQVFAHLRVLADSLARTAHADRFELHVLSDSDDPGVLAREAAHRAAWARNGRVVPLHYRHRAANEAYKAGNIREFVDREAGRFDHFVVLDADSLMTGPALVRLARAMQAHPEIGIIQTLAVGLPSDSPFARVFQFGMRHAMRPYTIGSAWWQGDQGPYWGHNAIVRMAPFAQACALPVLPGSGPLAGHVLSHDQVEAVLMRRAGYEVRVLPLEGGSFEKNPPTLSDFIKRDLRWCQGNLQYLWLLGLPGLRLLGRVQLALAILMYLAAPAWLCFLLIGVTQVFVPAVAGDSGGTYNVMLGLALFGLLMTMNLAPKLFGALDVLLNAERRHAWGGAARIGAQTFAETAFSMLLAPVIAVAQTLFIGGLTLGKRLGWAAQARASHRLTLSEAMATLWPQTLLGLAGTAALLHQAPTVALWTSPVLAGLVLCAPLAALSSRTGLGRVMARARLFAIPEEFDAPRELEQLAGVQADAGPGKALALLDLAGLQRAVAGEGD